jgi:hypothetical protein
MTDRLWAGLATAIVASAMLVTGPTSAARP